MRISKAEYTTRVRNLQKKILEKEIDALIVSEEEDIYYLTGLTYKCLERLFLLVVKLDQINFILPKMELAHLKKVDNVNEIKCYWEYPSEKPGRWQDLLLKEFKRGMIIGLSPKSPIEIGLFLQEQNLEVISCNIIEKLRWIKSREEIKLIKISSKYCDLAISKLNNNAYFGMSELEVFSIGRDIQKKVKVETEFNYLATAILVAAWPSRISFQPHGIPRVDDLLIQRSHISLAFLRINGYAAELERTFFYNRTIFRTKRSV